MQRKREENPGRFLGDQPKSKKRQKDQRLMFETTAAGIYQKTIREPKDSKRESEREGESKKRDSICAKGGGI